MIDHRQDIQLIAAVRKGDIRSFNILVMRYQLRILKIVSRYVRDSSEMNDVCQEVFIKAYKALNKFRGDSTFYTWLYKIAINTSKNYRVSQGRKLPDLDLQAEDFNRYITINTPKEHNTPEKLLMRDEIEHAVYDTIDHLPQDLRKTIMLREMDGLSYEEIAEVMHCPVGTVRSRIYRARSAIDKRVQPLL